MKNYVAGFLLSEDSQRVALVRKLKGPPVLHGKLNAIGGKVEPGEFSSEAMVREFREETGVEIPISLWVPFLVLSREVAWSVDFYIARSDRISKVQTVEEEPVDIYSVSDLEKLDVVPNLRWILPMALSFGRGETAGGFTAQEQG